jgi:hypothetical protein
MNGNGIWLMKAYPNSRRTPHGFMIHLRFSELRSNSMLRYALIFWALAVGGCANTPPTPLTLSHDVDVPRKYRAGNFSEEHPGYDEGNSSVERYVNAYEQGFQAAVQEHVKNINFQRTTNFFIMSGWVEETDGGPAGYGAATDRIEELIRVYGKQKVSAYLQQFKEPEDE